MKQVSIVGIIFTVGLLVLLKVFQDQILRVNEPLTNILIFVSVVIFAVIYGASQLSKKNK